MQRSSSSQSMNIFNDYIIRAHTNFMQFRGQDMFNNLKKHFERNISTYEFQHFILDCFDDLMTNRPLIKEENTIDLFERCCDDNMICFSNVVHRIDPKRLSNDESKEKSFFLV